MATQTIKNKISVDLINLKSNFTQLLLCMFVSHYTIGNPLFGVASFLLANIWIIYYQGGLFRGKTKNNSKLGMWILLSLSAIFGLSLLFIYPVVMNQPKANYISFFVAILTVRNLLSYKFNVILQKKSPLNTLYKLLLQAIFIIPALMLSHQVFTDLNMYIFWIGYIVSGVILVFSPRDLDYTEEGITEDKLSGISSYSIFKNMSLYAQIAYYLGVMMYFLYIALGQTSFKINIYIFMIHWLIFTQLLTQILSRWTHRQGKVLRLGLFLFGITMWIIGSVKMFDVVDLLPSIMWSLFWCVGISSINASLMGYNEDFLMVAEVADKRVKPQYMRVRTIITRTVASIVACCIMLVIVSVWSFASPNIADEKLPILLRNAMIQLPILFMIIALFFALRQPLNIRNREKLLLFHKSKNKDKTIQKSLKKVLVSKSRVRIGVKIIAFLLKPFLRLKVYGKENLDSSEYPSIFVCNHGVFYGPIATVIYLPTYFRPWVDRKMLYHELTSKELYERITYRMPLLSKKAKKRVARWIAKPVNWAMNSFNPIPVERDNLRNIIDTFNATIKALEEGDNILLFPERPAKIVEKGHQTLRHQKDTVGEIYTGFAQIGKMYYEKTGKHIRFYPVYTNKHTHSLRIGNPIIFDSNNPHQEEKLRIATSLHDSITRLVSS